MTEGGRIDSTPPLQQMRKLDLSHDESLHLNTSLRSVHIQEVNTLTQRVGTQLGATTREDQLTKWIKHIYPDYRLAKLQRLAG